MKLIAIPGTNSKNSTNRTLLQFIQKEYRDLADIEIVEIGHFPEFNKPQDRRLPAEVEIVADKIDKADGVIISTPEYNHTFTSAMTRALAWLSYGIYPFLDKPVLVVGASYGRLGSSRAQAHLNAALDAEEIQALKMPANPFLLGYSLQAFDEDGNLKDEGKKQELEKVMKNFTSFVESSKQLISKKRVVDNEDKFNWN